MAGQLTGKRIAFLVANSGVEQVAQPSEYDGLVLPGGTTNPDHLRLAKTAVAFGKAFADAGKPAAAVCHGPWTLIEADILGGKTLTSRPSLQTDITNAGGSWVDEESFTCPDNDWTLVTSRNPDDLPAFGKAAIAAFAQPDVKARGQVS